MGGPSNGEEFVYSEDLWAIHGLPELWVSGLGVCGHRVDGRGAAGVLNDMIRMMIAGELEAGDEHPVLSTAEPPSDSRSASRRPAAGTNCRRTAPPKTPPSAK